MSTAVKATQANGARLALRLDVLAVRRADRLRRITRAARVASPSPRDGPRWSSRALESAPRSRGLPRGVQQGRLARHHRHEEEVPTMSVEKVKRKAGTVYRVRWREGGRNRARAFNLRGDADRWQTEVDRRRQLGTLHLMDAGTETLDEYTAGPWAD